MLKKYRFEFWYRTQLRLEVKVNARNEEEAFILAKKEVEERIDEDWTDAEDQEYKIVMICLGYSN